MLELFLRIVFRYLLIPLLLWAGVPPDLAHQILNDPDVMQLLVLGIPAAGALIEGWTWWARRRGRMT